MGSRVASMSKVVPPNRIPCEPQKLGAAHGTEAPDDGEDRSVPSVIAKLLAGMREGVRLKYGKLEGLAIDVGGESADVGDVSRRLRRADYKGHPARAPLEWAAHFADHPEAAEAFVRAVCDAFGFDCVERVELSDDDFERDLADALCDEDGPLFAYAADRAARRRGRSATEYARAARRRRASR
jgi:hypothetical protein